MVALRRMVGRSGGAAAATAGIWWKENATRQYQQSNLETYKTARHIQFIQL